MSQKASKYLQNRLKIGCFTAVLTQFSLQICAEAGPNRSILSGPTGSSGPIWTADKILSGAIFTHRILWRG
jgi:hypothetical protein